MKRKVIAAGVALAIIVVGWYGVNALFATNIDIPTAEVHRGEFMVSLNVNGVVDARQAFVLSTPRIKSLQITWLAPEGSIVKAGDPVIRFDVTQVMTDLTDHQSSLKINRTALERAEREYTIQEKQLKLELQQAQRDYDEKKHEAPKLAEEARLKLELAQLNFQAKLDQIKSDVQKAQLEVQRAQDKVNASQRELEQLTITAPIPGMVVYLEIWKGGTMSKVQAGDSPWPGQGLVNLPDLSSMIVKATASEVDASVVDSGQEVIVKLDALPDTAFKGTVYKKGTLARKKDHNSKVNVFDVEVAIHDHDARLKPGMSASGRIIIDRVDSVISVPLEAVFEKDGRPVVYLDNKDEKPVQVGRRNDMLIEVVDGLEEGQRVCLVDPTLDEPSMPGEQASEPELNSGRSKRGNGGGDGVRRQRGR